MTSYQQSTAFAFCLPSGHMAGVTAMATFAREQGISVDRILAGTGLQEVDLEMPGAVAAPEGELRAIQNLTALAGNRPAIGLEIGSRYSFTSLGVLGFAMVSSSSLPDAARLLERYHSLFDRFVRVELQVEDDCLLLEFKPLADGDLSAHRFLMERAIGAVLAVLRDISNDELSPRELALSFTRPFDIQPYADLTGARLRFDAEGCAVRIGFGEEALPRSNVLSAIFAEDQCRQACESAARAGGVSARVAGILHASELRDMGAIAAKLCMSERTLRRNLQREGTSFQALCDEMRERKAEQLLTDSTLPIEHIAERLGYAESASFIHAFKRWKGSTPQAFRRDAGCAVAA